MKDVAVVQVDLLWLSMMNSSRFRISTVLFVLVVTPQLGHTDKTLTLRHVIGLFRHGARTPIQPYQTDPYKDEFRFWPEGFGQLTREGMKMAFDLGKYFKDSYGDFIGDYRYDKIYVRSTDCDRTLMTASAVVASLFQPNESFLDSQLNWQPIPIHSANHEDDILMGFKECPKYVELFEKEMKRSTLVNSLFQKNEELLQYLSEKTGQPIQTMDDVKMVYDVLNIQDKRGLELPEWTKSVFPEAMLPLVNYSHVLETLTPDLARLKFGTFIDEIISIFQKVQSALISQDDSVHFNRKMTLFSAHDTTISGVLNSLGLFESPHFPPYTASVFFELFSDQEMKEFYISISYRNDTSQPAAHLALAGCNYFCPLSRFDQLTFSLRPRNWHEECKVENKDDVKKSSKTMTAIIVLTALGIAFIIILIIRHFWLKTSLAGYQSAM